MSTTMGARPYEFLLSEAPGTLSREEITVLSGQNLTAGTVLGKVTLAAATASAIVGTGNATISAIVVGAGAQPGAHKLIAESATKLDLWSPAGVRIGQATAGTAATLGGLTFTVTAGGTAMVAGDTFTITVAAGSGSYVAYDNTNTNGSDVAAGVLVADCDARAGDTKAVMIARHAEVYSAKLTGADAAGLADLAGLTILARS